MSGWMCAGISTKKQTTGWTAVCKIHASYAQGYRTERQAKSACHNECSDTL